MKKTNVGKYNECILCVSLEFLFNFVHILWNFLFLVRKTGRTSYGRQKDGEKCQNPSEIDSNIMRAGTAPWRRRNVGW